VLTYVPRLHMNATLAGLALTPWLLMGATLLLAWLAARWLKFSRETFAVVVICVGFGNTSFVGYPMVRALLGDGALPYAVVHDQFGTFMMLSTLGLYLLARFSGGTPPTTAQVLARMGRFPPLWALIAAVLVMPENSPHWIGGALKSVADTMLPLVMLSVGLSIRLRLRAEERAAGPGAGAAAGAAGAGDPAVDGLRPARADVPGQRARIGDADDDHRRRAGHLPPTRPRLAAALVGYSIVIALATLPAWTWVAARLAG
jgi:predicted permease